MAKFQRPPMTDKEKERFADSFMDSAPRSSPEAKKDSKKNRKGRGVIYLRCAQSLIDDLLRIEELTGYKHTMFCLQAITEATREKLKVLERDID